MHQWWPNVVPDGSLITFNYDVDPEDGEPSRISLLQLGHRIRHGVKVCPGQDDDHFFPSGNLPSSSSTSRPAVQHDTSEVEPMDEDGLDFAADRRAQGDPSTPGVLHMFHRQGDYKTIAFTKGNPFHERAQIAEGWGVDVQDIIGIHPVRTPPSDIAGDVGSTVAITRWTQDAAYRTFPTDVQCLYDVELHSGQLSETGPKIFRHVEWTRRLMTREGLLHRLWVGDYCRLIAQEACLVWRNRVLWPSQDFQPRRILAGDYFRVAIPARPRQGIVSIRQFLRATENQVPDHTMFPSSPASTSTDRAGDSESDESTHTQYGPPPVLPEPEPHDVFGSVSCFLRGWAKDRHCHKAKICLHGLCGQPLGSQSFILQNVMDEAHLIELLVSFWTCPTLMKVQIYEVNPQPQSLLSDAHHFILEFCPTTTTISTQVAPILIEDLVCGDGGVPCAKWFGAYAPRLGGCDDWNYLLVDADVMWIGGLRPEPDKSFSVVEGTLLTRCTYTTDPTISPLTHILMANGLMSATSFHDYYATVMISRAVTTDWLYTMLGGISYAPYPLVEVPLFSVNIAVCLTSSRKWLVTSGQGCLNSVLILCPVMQMRANYILLCRRRALEVSSFTGYNLRIRKFFSMEPRSSLRSHHLLMDFVLLALRCHLVWLTTRGAFNMTSVMVYTFSFHQILQRTWDGQHCWYIERSLQSERQCTSKWGWLWHWFHWGVPDTRLAWQCYG